MRNDTPLQRISPTRALLCRRISYIANYCIPSRAGDLGYCCSDGQDQDSWEFYGAQQSSNKTRQTLQCNTHFTSLIK